VTNGGLPVFSCSVCWSF